MIIKQNTKTILIALILALFAMYLQAQNMFQYPYYQDVEGTNVSNGISFVETGELSPYTYAYEEPPVGLYVFGFWTSIADAFADYDFSLKTGRLLMLVLHFFTVLLIYGIAKKATKSDLAAILASLVFIFSPLVTTMQRVALLDNIMVVWLLLAFYIIMGEKRILWNYISSAILFGIAVLTKGSALFYLPAFMIIIAITSDKHHRRFALGIWAALACALLISYPLYALMHQELFPQGWILSGDYPHVSLWEVLMDRGPETGRFLNAASGLSDSFKLWVDVSTSLADPILIYGGIASFFFLVILSKDNPYLRPFPIMMFFYAMYLLFGGPVVKTDIVSALPFLALSVAILITAFTKLTFQSLPKGVLQYAGALVVLIVATYPFWAFYSSRLDIYTENQVEGQLAAIEWVNERLPEDALIVTDNYAFVELRRTHENTHYFWKVDTDPDVKFSLLEDNLCNIDYLVVTPQVFTDIQQFNMELMKRAVDNSEILRTYPNNGWPIEIRQVDKSNCSLEVATDTR